MATAELWPCQTEGEQRLYDEGKLGVASSVDILMANIQRFIDEPQRHFLEYSPDQILKDPRIASRGSSYNMAYFPESGRENIEVNVVGSGTREEVLQRAKRNLAYKTLRRKATHITNYEEHMGENSVTLSGIPMILTQGM